MAKQCGPRKYVSETDYRFNSVTVLSVSQPILGSNSDRYCILIKGIGVDDTQMDTAKTIATGPGLFTIKMGQELKLTFDEYGPLITDAWFATPGGPNSQIFVTEMYFIPK